MTIYLDHAASAPLHPDVWDAMRPWALKSGNAASSHAFGRAVRKALDDARERIAGHLDAEPDEVVFTSGATEANNLALFGLASSPGVILSSAIEHPCVTEPIQKLVARGFHLHALPVGRDGVVQLSSPTDVRLAALMLANHETGAIQPVAELRSQLPTVVPLHCDAAAAVGRMPLSFRRLGVSTLTLSAHKFHGPPGIGVLLIKKGVRLTPQLFGGHQQQSKRPGTEPVALVVGLATALDRAIAGLDASVAHVRRLKDAFLTRLSSEAGPIRINSPDQGLPHVINVSFPGISADALLMALDLAGVACSTGSACSSGSLLPSPVLRAMGLEDAALRSAMRFSIAGTTTEPEIAEACDRIVRCVKKLRRLAEVAD